MSDETLTNAAVELLRAGVRSLNVAERDEYTRRSVTDDFVFDDRRSGVNLGRFDASGYSELIRSTWDVGSGRPSWSMRDVIAVRGQRIAAVDFVIEFGNDMHTDSIVCVCFDPQLKRLQREVHFDVDDRDAAIAEVDRMQAEIDD